MATEQPEVQAPPQRRELSAVWALPAVVAAWVWAAGWLPEWAERVGGGFPRWLMAAGGAVVLVLGVWRTRSRWTEAEYGPGMAPHGYTLSCVVGVAAGVWLVRAAYSSPWHQAPLLLLGLGVGIAWWWQLSTLAPKRAAAVVAQQTPAVPAGVEDPEVRRLLDAAWCADVAIYEVEENRAGQRWLLGPSLTDEDGVPRPDLVSFDDFANRLTRVRGQLAAHWRPRGVTLTEGDVRPEQLTIDRWNLHINTKHVEKETVPASLTPAPRSWNMPVWLGLFLDGADMEVTLCGNHLKVVGATGGGKSVVANNVIRGAVMARQAGRRDALVWVCASAKFKPLIWPWLEPWLAGRTQRPVLDWVVGEDAEEVVRFLRSVYYLCVDRNRRLDVVSKWQATPQLPGVCVVIEEAKHLTGTGAFATMENGEEWTADRLIAELAAVARSAAVNLVALTQQGLFGGLGSYGEEAQRNFTVRVVTVTETVSDGTNNLPKLVGQNVNTTALEDNTIYLQPSLADTARAMPGKVSLLDGSEYIGPVVLEASVLPPPELEPDGVAAVGEAFYRSRWHAERQTLLADAVSRRGWQWPGGGDVTAALGQDGVATDGPVTAEAVTPPAATPPGPPPAGPSGATPPVTVGGPAGGEDPEGWDPAWNEDLDMLLRRGRWSRNPDVTPPAAPDTEGTGRHGLPGEESMRELERLARKMSTEADQATAAGVGNVDVSGAGEGLPEPLRSVVKVAAARAVRGADWVATAELAEEVWGTTDENAVRRLGRAVSVLLPGLSTTNPRDYGAGRRGRGYLLGELQAAVQQYRTEHPEPE